MTYYVTDAPFSAHGDGIHNDRDAIQAAIDRAYGEGGGTVVLTEGGTFLSTPLVLRSNITLLFGDGATLLQSEAGDEYTVYEDGEYKPRKPYTGHNNFESNIQWNHRWYSNIPLIFAGEGTKNIRITGNGIISMTKKPCEDAIHCCPIGLYRVTDFEISDIHIRDYHSYAVAIYTCRRGLVSGVRISDYLCWNTDGFSIMNSSDLHFTNCNVSSGDDALYLFSSYSDDRAHQEGAWWSSDEPEPCENIEIDHCDLVTRGCKGFAMILWGMGSEDKEKVEIRNVYIHDNHIASIGIWHSEKHNPPVTEIRFENNDIEVVESNFRTTRIAALSGFPSVQCIMNDSFADGRCFWTMKGNAGVVRDTPEEGVPYGYVRAGEGRNSLAQGNYIRSDLCYLISADVKAEGDGFMISVRDLDTDRLVDSHPLEKDQSGHVEHLFKVSRAGNYYIGIESAGAPEGCVHVYKFTCNEERIWRT